MYAGSVFFVNALPLFMIFVILPEKLFPHRCNIMLFRSFTIKGIFNMLNLPKYLYLQNN